MFFRLLFHSYLVLLLAVMLPVYSFSQKGIPPPEKTNASVSTNYPQHEDFKESLVSRLKTAPGFMVNVAASGLGKPRMMALGANGSLYVTRRDVGDVLLLNDTNGDGKYDELHTIVSQFNDVHGITLHEGWLYLCSSKKLARGKLNADGTVGPMDTLIADLPDGGQHDNRTIAFGPDGKLYITVGSDCNDCKETNPEHATIVQTNADGSGRRVYARGLRNTIGFDWHPATKELWGMDHGTDWRGDEIPPEELNKIVENGDYGWPLVYGKQQVDPTREDPVGTTKAAYAKKTQAAVMTFPAHSAPIDFRFLGKATNYAADQQDDALVTWHGSWNRKDPEGYKVQRIKFENGQPTGVEDFLSGFLSVDKKTRFGRPAGLVISDKGEVFISDDENGIIYRVTKK
ncbi:MAG TPA: PQQ-dependent sugar dehydrogenase [Flavisolibacter sp.]|jgi:glucose/arabinose dehydrogenase|nr:PQQ-dependent sugar dehydrogenase [Flavisolibacter sp.]